MRTRGAAVAWHKRGDDPYRSFACRVLFAQGRLASCFRGEGIEGEATVRSVLLEEYVSAGRLRTMPKEERKALCDRLWDEIREREIESYDDWLADDNPYGAAALLELLGYDSRAVNAYRERVTEALRGEYRFDADSSRYNGVFKKGKAWSADISFDGKHLRRVCKTEEEAARQVNEWIIEHGLDRKLNEVGG